MHSRYKHIYRRLRNLWGWILGAAWVVFWYFRLNNNTAEECAGMIASAGCSLTAGFGLILALLTAPFAFVVSHYIGRFAAEREERDDAERERLASDRERARLNTEMEEQRRTLAAQDASTRRTMERKIFIQKIGTARDALSAQSQETEAGRRALAAQQVSMALRDLATRYDLQEMKQLVNGDEAVSLLVRALLDDLRNSMQFPPEARLLEQALGSSRAGAKPNPPSAPPTQSKYRM